MLEKEVEPEDAFDPEDILAYCQSKGIVTIGLTPFEAVKKQLAFENGKRTNYLVEQSHRVTTGELRINEIHIGQLSHYDSVDSRKAIASNGSKPFTGVVYERENGQYVLVDGYHRIKYAKEQNYATGWFLILW